MPRDRNSVTEQSARSVIDSNRRLQESTQKLHRASRDLEEKNKELAKAAEVEAQVRDDLEHKLVELNPDGLFVLDKEGFVLFANPAAAIDSGLPPTPLTLASP